MTPCSLLLALGGGAPRRSLLLLCGVHVCLAMPAWWAVSVLVCWWRGKWSGVLVIGRGDWATGWVRWGVGGMGGTRPPAQLPQVSHVPLFMNR